MITNLIPKYQYSGNGVTQVFAFPALFLDNTHLKVVFTTAGLDTIKTYLTDYTVSGVNNPSGGNVTTNTIPAIGTTVTIYRDPPLTQLIDYINGDNFPAETHEAALDKLTMLCMLLSARVDRCFRIPLTNGIVSEFTLNDRKSKIPGFDYAGNATYTDGPVIGDVTNVAITAFTGGTGVCLDAVSTVGLTIGTILRIQIGGVGNSLTTVQLLAISTAPSAGAIIRPVDYHGTTNIKEWVVIG